MSRRNRLAYLALLRRVTDYAFRAALWRGAAVLVVFAVSCLSDRFWWVLPLVVLAATGPLLNLFWVRYVAEGEPEGPPVLLRYIDHVEGLSGRHQMTLAAYLDVAGMVALVVAASWLLTDVPPWARVAALVGGAGFWVSTAVGIFNDHSWFNPAEVPPRWHEWIRPYGGPISVALLGALALPAPWREDEWLAAVLVCLSPMLITVRVWENDLTMRSVADLVREQAHEGRELVLREMHGALSTQLRLIVQYAREHRDQLPQLYDLAVSADARLRETLTLGEKERDTSRTADALAAPVTMLGRAVGASTTVDIAVATLSPANHELARLVLVDLVGNALNAGALHVAVRLDIRDGDVRVTVRDDARPMPESVWQSAGTSSYRLASQLHALAGSLVMDQQDGSKTVTARWSADRCNSGAADQPPTDARA